MTDKIELREVVIVEGRYDRIKLSTFISSPVMETGGFRVFKDTEKQRLIRSAALKRGILIMTDVDSAGFVIRNFLRGIVPADKVLHAYIPTVIGKEKRKSEPSKEGTLGVEGMKMEALVTAIKNSGAHIIGSPDEKRSEITKLDFFEYGLTGAENSAERRGKVLSSLGLPKYLSVNAMIDAVNCLFTKEEFEEYLEKISDE